MAGACPYKEKMFPHQYISLSVFKYCNRQTENHFHEKDDYLMLMNAAVYTCTNQDGSLFYCMFLSSNTLPNTNSKDS